MATAKKSALEAWREQQNAANNLRDSAIQELLNQRKAIDAQLAEFGHGDSGARSGRGSGVKRPVDPNKPCGICGFATVPNHDGRKHRSQGDKRKPFTAAALSDMGMSKK